MQPPEQKKYFPPLNFQQLADLWMEVLKGEKSNELFLAQLARSASVLSEDDAKKLEKLVAESIVQHKKEEIISSIP